jgi:hypothetical protein
MSRPEEILAAQMRVVGLPEPVREYVFAPPRRWRFDFAWPDLPITDRWAVEVEGGTWVNGRHGRGAGFQNDCEKYNRAALLGWRVLRVTPAQIRSGAALAWIERAVGGRQ